jgi:hypothetical protein
MRRALVSTNEAARHPFRQYHMPSADWTPMPDRSAKRTSDFAFFGASYVGFFVLIMGMIL